LTGDGECALEIPLCLRRVRHQFNEAGSSPEIDL
jgi:hypothetical protein